MTQQYTGDVDWFRTRGINSSASSFMPHIKPGIALLDCGCGPGSITLDFAEALAPGEVTGIDIDPWMIEQARAAAAERGTANVRFEVGDIYKLPFADASFDALWVASVMQYLADPVAAAKEMIRVLKPGGVLGARDRNYEGDIVGNANPKIRRAFKIYYRWQHSHGTNLKFGASQREVLLKAGLTNVLSSATYESHAAQWASERYSQLVPMGVEALGLQGSVDANGLVEAWGRWAEDPRSDFCMARCEAVGWKPA